MSEVPSFFTKSDFYDTLLPGYLVVTAYIFFFRPDLFVSTASLNLLTSAVFLVAGPAIGLTLTQGHRIVLYNIWPLRKGFKHSRKALKDSTMQYYRLQLLAKPDEIHALDLQESIYDFNVSAAIGLGAVVTAHLYLAGSYDIISVIVLAACVILLIGAYYAYQGYGDYRTILASTYFPRPAGSAAVAQQVPSASASAGPKGPETEDYLSFASALIGALGSTLQKQNGTQTLLLGLVVAAMAKALPSLADPSKKGDRKEDSVLFFAAILGYLGGGIQSKFSFSDPGSQEIVILGLAIGLAGKALLSLNGNRRSLEDWIPTIAAVASAVSVLLGGTQFAAVGIFLGFLGKQLASQGDGAQPLPQSVESPRQPATNEPKGAAGGGPEAAGPATAAQASGTDMRARPGQGIAVIGFGSLIWEPRLLRLRSKWHPNGPSLPVEYARVSEDKRLTLVIVPGVEPQRTLWAYSACGTLEEAKENLRCREGTRIEHIGAWKEGTDPVNDPTALTISKWVGARGLEGAVWAALPPKDGHGEERPMPAEEALEYLSGLRGYEKEAAREYVVKTPEQVNTKVRRLAREQLGWTDYHLQGELLA